jgi:hypothetical protein
MRPVELEASLDAPDEAAPGASVTVQVETDRPAHCLLLVYEARMAGRDPLAGLARRIFEHIFDATWRLEAGRATQVAWLLISGLQTMELQLRLRGGGQSMRSHLRQAHQAALKRGAPRVFFMAPGETTPAMTHVELFPVHGRVELPVQLGDGAGPWRCLAYVFDAHDYVSLSRDIEVR